MDVKELLERHPAEVYLWLQEWTRQGRPISHDADMNWLLLAECAAAYACNAYGKHSALESILWGSIGITVRDGLAKGESQIPASSASAMAIRCNLIMTFGNHPGDPLCDSKIILDWFYEALAMTFQEATNEARRWHTNPGERKFEFKWIIEQLEMIRPLVAARRLEADPQLQQWLELLEGIRPSDCPTPPPSGRKAP